MSPGSARALVLYYHRVSDDPEDPFSLAVTPANFQDHLDVMCELADVVPARQIVDGRFHRRRRAHVAVTFDDGYRDNYVVAAPQLRAAGLPATFFVTTSVLQPDHEFWWDRLARIVGSPRSASRHLTVTVGSCTVTADVGNVAARRRALTALRNRLYTLPVDVISGVLAEIDVRDGDSSARPREGEFLTPGDLARLRELPGVEVGSHAVSHVRLAGQSLQLQKTEIEGSQRRLAAACGEPVDLFAYPYGDRGSYDRRTLRLVRSRYRAAFTTDHGPVGWWTDPRRVPRYRVGNWNADEFRREFRCWLGAQ
ncbi:MAG TPA: polysaccharide deacetylase family protein [Mycobacteriales bacterium]|nr:polysaccharide deacetylase family protein [Mycobacteriales bacterium]